MNFIRSIINNVGPFSCTTDADGKWFSALYQESE